MASELPLIRGVPNDICQDGMEFQLYRAFNLTTALREMLLSAKSEDNETVALVAAFRP